jgi:hypothetical protein
MAWDSSLGGLQAMLALNLVAFLQARCWRKADRLPLGKVQPLSDRAPSSVIVTHRWARPEFLRPLAIGAANVLAT